MCKKYPGQRCGNQKHERLQALMAQVEEAKAFRDALDPDLVRRPEISKANRQVTVLERQVAVAQQRYDATNEGYAALEAESKDADLSSADRNALKVRLKDAAKERAERIKMVTDSEARRANVMLFLEQSGIPANERAAFDDTNIYLPATGSDKHYETIKNNRMKVYQNRLAEYNKALAKASTPAETAKVEEKEKLALEKARSDYNRALYRYDATSAGIGALKAKVAKASICYTAQDEVALAKLEVRLGNGLKAHRQSLDARNQRTAKLASLKAIVSAHGGDVAGAVEAFKNKNPLPKRQGQRVPQEQMRASKVYAHLTAHDTTAIETEFKKSTEYMAGGETARARFMERKIMTPPHELYMRESLDAADSKVTIASTGKTGRNNTVIGNGGGIARNQLTTACLTDNDAQIIRNRAAFLSMSKSSYIRAMLLGENPLARENDRSAVVRARKYAKGTEILNGGLIAA